MTMRVVSLLVTATLVGATPAASADPARFSPEDTAVLQRLCPPIVRAGASGALHSVPGCGPRVVAQMTERRELAARLKAWADNGVEPMTDAQLDAYPADAAATIQRLEAVSEALGMPVDREMGQKAIAAVGRDVAAEKACRLDPKCVADRAARRAEEAFRRDVLGPLCDIDQQREDLARQLAFERANPSGFVDRALMYRLGRSLQAGEESFAALLPTFTAAKRRAWRGWRAECPAR
jgi:hypothetical protein